MESEEMFKKLGWHYFSYLKNEKEIKVSGMKTMKDTKGYYPIYIKFDLETQDINVDISDFKMSLELLNAINNQVEELGWK